MKQSILFFGELTPNIVHGISLANSLNIGLLSKEFSIKIIEEKSDLKNHNKTNISKIKQIFSFANRIYKYNKKDKYNYFYTIFSLSTLGSLKTLILILSYILSGKDKIILHIHRGDFEIFYYKNILNKFISKIIFRMINKLIVLSCNQKNEFSKYIDSSKIFILENSLLEEYKMIKQNIESSNFIYISNYIKEKGIYELLTVFKSYNDKYLECFGSFVNNEEDIRRYDSKNIKVNDFINGKNKFVKLNQADALILPSWNEGQPTIILEAMMMGTIVLTTKVGLIEELLGDDYPFYFKERDKISLQNCIKKFERYKDKEQLSKKLITIYYEKYSKYIHEQKLVKIFKEKN